jgi:magnesium-transporting ATPase (P-type)
MIRAFAVLGLTEAAISLSAFVVSLHAQGWRFGQESPSGSALLAASGAAFTAIVLGQVANAFACRSVDRPAWMTDVRTNPLLLAAVLSELGLLLALLYVPPVAHVLGHSGPTIAGLTVAVMAIPAVLLVDGIHKRFRRHVRDFRL